MCVCVLCTRARAPLSAAGSVLLPAKEHFPRQTSPTCSFELAGPAATLAGFTASRTNAAPLPPGASDPTATTWSAGASPNALLFSCSMKPSSATPPPLDRCRWYAAAPSRRTTRPRTVSPLPFSGPSSSGSSGAAAGAGACAGPPPPSSANGSSATAAAGETAGGCCAAAGAPPPMPMPPNKSSSPAAATAGGAGGAPPLEVGGVSSPRRSPPSRSTAGGGGGGGAAAAGGAPLLEDWPGPAPLSRGTCEGTAGGRRAGVSPGSMAGAGSSSGGRTEPGCALLSAQRPTQSRPAATKTKHGWAAGSGTPCQNLSEARSGPPPTAAATPLSLGLGAASSSTNLCSTPCGAKEVGETRGTTGTGLVGVVR
jgi:hypothetical protein